MCLLSTKQDGLWVHISAGVESDGFLTGSHSVVRRVMLLDC